MQEILDREKTLDEAMISFLQSEIEANQEEINRLKRLVTAALEENNRLQKQVKNLERIAPTSTKTALDCPF